MPPETAFASPLSLLLAEADAREVLIISFTLDLSFWERVALGAARALGARVTVVGDARYVNADPRRVRGAGRSYLDGRALCRSGAAFHPKVVVIAGERGAQIAIGSGNATLPGWGDNEELWTVLRCGAAHAPQAAHTLAGWLESAPRFINFSPGVSDAFSRVGEILRRAKPDVEGPLLLSNLEKPLLDQLPPGPVDELNIVVPFIDEGVRAIRALCDRLGPRKIRIAIQPNLTSVSGKQLEVAARELGAEVYRLDERRYRHGKLFEWRTRSVRHALIGSPNASMKALYMSVASGGNCELALLASLKSSLVPEGSDQLSSREIQALVLMSRDQNETLLSLVVLSAELEDAGVRLTIAKAPPAGELLIEVVRDRDVWVEVARMPAAGPTSIVIPLVAEAGSALRIRTDSETSNTVFITDRGQVLRRVLEHTGRTRTDPGQIFKKASVFEAFVQDLLELKSYVRSGASGGGGPGGAHPGKSTHKAFQSWEEYLESIESHIGRAMATFGLGLPSFGEVAESEGDTEVDEEEEALQPRSESQPRRISFSDADARQRARYQRWFARLVNHVPALAPVAKAVSIRLVLEAIAGQLWETPDEWVPVLCSTVTGATEALSTASREEIHPIASLIALSLSLSYEYIRYFGPRGPLEVAFDRAFDAAKDWLPSRDAGLVERFSIQLREDLGLAVYPDVVDTIMERLLETNPVDHAIEALAELGIDAGVHDKLIVIRKRSPDPRRLAMRAVGLASKSSPLGAWAPANDGGWAAVVSDDKRTVIYRRWEKVLHGALYRASSASLLTFATTAGWELGKYETASWHGVMAPVEAQDLMVRTGLTLDGIAASLRRLHQPY